MATKDTRPAKFDDTDAPTGRHRPLSLSEAPRSVDDDDDDVDDDGSLAPRRARRRPRPEHISTPPRFASAADEDDGDDDDDERNGITSPERPLKKAAPRAKKAASKTAAKGKATGKKRAAGLRDSLPLEISGVVVFAINVLLLLSLLSYEPGDGQPGRPVENWIGPGGAVVADLLTITFGAMAFALPVFLMALVAACFRPIEKPRHAALRTLSGVFASLSLMSLMHLVFRGTQVLPFPAGGLVGALLADAGSKVLAPLGTGIVAVAGAFIGTVVALDRPLGGTTRSILDRLVDAWHAATEQLHVWREERRLLAEEHERLELDESLPETPAVDVAEQARQQLRLEKADARQKRIVEKARARATQRLEDESEERAERAERAQALQGVDVVDGTSKGKADVATVLPLVAGRQPPAVMPRDAQKSTKDAVAAAVAAGPAVAPAVVAEPDFENATVVQSDPPWAREIDDGTVVSLAEAMEKARRTKALQQPEVMLAQPLPSMMVDEELKIIEREDDAATLVAEAERMDAVEHQQLQVVAAKREYMLPPLNLLDYDAPVLEPLDEGKLRSQADKLVAKFMDFGIEGRVREIRPGPVVTTYEFVPAPGIKVSKISALSDDIAMAMEAVHVRIVAPIPGKGAVGIEIPNEKRETVYMKEIIADPQFKKREEKLMMALGKDIEGKSYYANLADMPHVLISGTTGSGKSVSVNAMICSILYRSTPEDVRFMMIDPKMLELSIYDGIPHLLLPPIIDSKKAAVALKWCVAEMERRYQLLSDMGVRDLKGFNDRVLEADAQDPTGGVKTGLYDKDGKRLGKMPFIVVIIDEYADLIAVAGKDVEGYVMRIAQKARAAGIHVMLATQRPSVDVITGVIKANFPVRMGFRLASNHDSKTIINQPGAEKLLGRGDMLFMPPGTSNVIRVHGAFISEKELHRVVDFLKQQGKPDYNMDILTYQDEGDDEGGGSAEEFANEPRDARYDEAIALVARTKKCSTSFVQRMLNIGYQRAARIVDRMEREGMVGAALNTKGDREIYLRPDGSIDSSQRVNM